MIVLPLKLPIIALQCMALLRRLPKNHPMRPIIERDLRFWLKGYYGEKECVYYLSFLPEDQYYIFHGIRLTDKKAFQMDLLIVSQSFALIAEVKNVSKKLIFKKESNHVIKEFNNEEEGIQNPILQVKRQRMQFINWLEHRQIKGLPIERLVVISKTSTLVETTPDNQQIYKELIYAESIIDKIQELEKKYDKPRFSKKNLTQLVDLLLDNHQPLITDILQTYKISKDEIKTGVICPKDQISTMTYYSGSWHCSNCHFSSKTAHLPTVDDYFLLLGPTITRKQLGEFLHIGSTFIAGKMVRALGLPFTGSKRGTTYFLPQKYEFIQPKEKDIKLPNAYFPR
ncbi:nuclease-related domain-containing protein [Bacillus sp. 1P10SD]|uniref:nuclease-related domain-containing protein n=1 Tax=Bacillus sp. 1P10SD TaxID=3132265 RepID=UPI0039A734EB